MDKSIEKSTTKVGGSPSLDKRKAEDELKTQTKRLKKSIASLKEDVDSLQVDVASLQELFNSVKATLALLPTKKDLHALFPSFKEEPAKKPASVENVIPVPLKSSFPEDHKAKADTNTPKKESSSNVSSRESDKVEKKTPNRTLFPCSSVNRVEVASEIGRRYVSTSSRESGKVEKETPNQTLFPCSSGDRLEVTSKIGRRVLFTCTGQERYDPGTLFVKGYDPLLSEDDIMRALLEHFSPCGMVKKIYFHLEDGTHPLKGYAFVEMIYGLEEALRLNGSNMGGWNLEVHNAKRRMEYHGSYNTAGSGRPYVAPRINPRPTFHPRPTFRSEKPPVYGIVPWSSSKTSK